MKSIQLIVTALVSVSAIGFFSSSAHALGNEISIRNTCYTGNQTIKGYSESSSSGIVKSTFKDTVTIDGGTKVVTGDEVLNTSSVTKLNIEGSSKTTYTEMSGVIKVD